MDTEDHVCSYKDTITGMRDDITEIKEALIGTLEKKGALTTVHENKKALEDHRRFNVFLVCATVTATIGTWVEMMFTE